MTFEITSGDASQAEILAKLLYMTNVIEDDTALHIISIGFKMKSLNDGQVCQRDVGADDKCLVVSR